MSALPQDQAGLSISAVLTRDEQGILSEWMKEMSDSTRRGDLIKESDLRSQCAHFLKLMKQGIQVGGSNFNAPAWNEVREMLSEISRTRAQQGFTPSETATFIFSVKRPLFTRI